MKKTLSVLLALLVLLGLGGCDNLGPVVFRGVKWGMSEAQVQRAERPDEPTYFDEELMIFSNEVNGQPVEIYYTFTEGRLSQAEYRFDWREVILEDQVASYVAYREQLIAEYGQPLDADYRVWTAYDEEFAADSDANQIYYHRMKYLTEWQTKESRITLLLDYSNERVNYQLVLVPLETQ